MASIIKTKIYTLLQWGYGRLKRGCYRAGLKNKTFTIISNDCWGGTLYQYFGLEYRTPFVGLYVMMPSYVKLLSNLSYYLQQPLKFAESSMYEEVENLMLEKGKRFPIGKLDDVEIEFLHYETENEALEKWNRRLQRMDFNNLFIKMDGHKDLCTPNLIQKFDQLEFDHKICITPEKHYVIKSNVAVKNWEIDGAEMFYKTTKSMNIVLWLNKGILKKKY